MKNIIFNLSKCKQIQEDLTTIVGIKSIEEYVDFFVNLNMGENVPLLSFVNNEKLVLKQKLKYKDLEKEPIRKGIEILENLAIEIAEIGEEKVLRKYKEKEE